MVRRMLINLGLILVIVFPIWFGILGLLANLNAGPQGVKDWPGSVLFFFLSTAPPLLAGGAVQQLLLLAIPPRWPLARQRIAAVLSTAVILPAVILIGGAGALIPGLLIYGLMLRLPREQEPEQDPA